MTELLDLLWSNNTGIGRSIIFVILILGILGCMCAIGHWLRYTSTEVGWLESVRGRLRRAQSTTESAAAPEGTEDIPTVAATIDLNRLAEGIPRNSLVGDRLGTILRMKQAQVKVSIAALQQSSILKESASWTLSLPAYIASIVMMLGLLGTFIGLSLMVADIQNAMPDPSAPAASTEWAASVSGLGRILAGKKTAFSATLAGLAVSIVVSMCNFGLARAQSKLYDELERFTTEELLPATVPALDDETPWEKLARQLGDSFENLQSLATAQARSAEQLAAVETTFGTVINNIEAMTQRAATAPLQSVAGEMTNVIGQLTQVQGAILNLTERLPMVITAFRDTHQSTLRELRGSMERMTQALQNSHAVRGRWSFSLALAGAALTIVVVVVLRVTG